MSPRPGSRRRRPLACLALVLAVLALPACKEIETETAAVYEPAHVHDVQGRDDVKLVTFTAEGAKRTGLRTAEVRRSGRDLVVPYAALIYDAQGKTYVYRSTARLSFLREEVRVDRIEGSRVFLVRGPRAGTQVVTVGAAEVYGTELDVAGSH